MFKLAPTSSAYIRSAASIASAARSVAVFTVRPWPIQGRENTSQLTGDRAEGSGEVEGEADRIDGHQSTNHDQRRNQPIFDYRDTRGVLDEPFKHRSPSAGFIVDEVGHIAFIGLEHDQK